MGLHLARGLCNGPYKPGDFAHFNAKPHPESPCGLRGCKAFARPGNPNGSRNTPSGCPTLSKAFGRIARDPGGLSKFAAEKGPATATCRTSHVFLS